MSIYVAKSGQQDYLECVLFERSSKYYSKNSSFPIYAVIKTLETRSHVGCRCKRYTTECSYTRDFRKAYDIAYHVSYSKSYPGKSLLFKFLYVRTQLGKSFSRWMSMSLCIYCRVERNKKAFREVFDITCYESFSERES